MLITRITCRLETAGRFQQCTMVKGNLQKCKSETLNNNMMSSPFSRRNDEEYPTRSGEIIPGSILFQILVISS